VDDADGDVDHPTRGDGETNDLAIVEGGQGELFSVLSEATDFDFELAGGGGGGGCAGGHKTSERTDHYAHVKHIASNIL